jgi:glycosyltransferase involved in cell wall biosynthesis
MSMVALEAGIQGKPVLATDTCGLAALSEIDGGGVCPATVDGLASGLREMFAASDLSSRGTRWGDFVRANYRWPDIAARLAAIFKGLT